MEEDVSVLALREPFAEGRDGTLGGLVAGAAALDDLDDLGQPGLGDDLLDVGHEARCHQHDDIVDALGVLEDAQRVLDDRFTGDLQQLLGDRYFYNVTATT